MRAMSSFIHGWKKAAALVAVMALLSGPAGAAGTGQESTADLWNAVLALVHDGRFDEADRLLARAARQDGEQANEAFFRAFVTYWRLLYDPDNEKLRERFGRRLDRTIELARAESKKEESWEAALWSGSAYLLRAQLRAMQKKVFRAGFDAKKAHRFLKRAAELGSEHAESDFGLGTYQYYASRVPGFVKFVRGLLTIPGGNREEGLRRLQRAARESLFFSLEARIVLANIYASNDEQMYDLALAETDAAGRQFPETLAVLDGTGRLSLSLYRTEMALENLERALAGAVAQPGTAPSVLANLRFTVAAAEYVRFRPDRALAGLQPLLADLEAVPRDLRGSARDLAGHAISLLVNPPAWVADLEDPLPVPTANAKERRKLHDAATRNGEDSTMRPPRSKWRDPRWRWSDAGSSRRRPEHSPAWPPSTRIQPLSVWWLREPRSWRGAPRTLFPGWSRRSIAATCPGSGPASPRCWRESPPISPESVARPWCGTTVPPVPAPSTGGMRRTCIRSGPAPSTTSHRPRRPERPRPYPAREISSPAARDQNGGARFDPANRYCVASPRLSSNGSIFGSAPRKRL